MTTQPKPCPFCGHKAQIDATPPSGSTRLSSVYIGCSSESCPVCPGLTRVTRVASVAAWNTRHESQEVAELRAIVIELAQMNGDSFMDAGEPGSHATVHICLLCDSEAEHDEECPMPRICKAAEAARASKGGG